MNQGLFLFRLIPPRADFAQTMTAEEQQAMAGTGVLAATAQ